MLNILFLQVNPVMLTNIIPKKSVIVIGQIAYLLGIILNAIYEGISRIPALPALGISIILLTIIARTIMLPFAFKSQKSMIEMQKLQPEMNKIKEKYAGATDPEIQRKMQTEMNALYANNNVNPFAGCLPMLLTMPIFFALNDVLRQTYIYIHKIGETYDALSVAVQKVPNVLNTLETLAFPKVPKGMAIDLNIAQDLTKVLNKFSLSDWETLKNSMSAGAWTMVQPFYDKKVEVESFLTINLVENAGLSWPGVIIPILTAAATLLSSFVMMKTSVSNDQSQKTQQMMMMVLMPIMIFMFTINMSSGVAIYWITSSIYQAVQQYFLSKYYSKNQKTVKP